MGLIFMVLVIILLLGALPSWPYSRNWGYAPSGLLSIVAVILLMLILFNVLPWWSPTTTPPP
jgi:hypothetical protein